MLIHELSQEECRALLGRTRLGRLACSRHDQPYVVPVFLELHEQHLYGFATLGRKIEWMRDNPKVCVEVEDVDDRDHWTTVVVIGRYEELTDEPQHAGVRETARQLLESRRKFWLPGAAKLPAQEHPTPVIYRIQIERMTGRKAARG